MADARLQVTIDAVDNASKQIKSVEASLNRFGAQARTVGIAMTLLGGAALAGMTLAIKSTAAGQEAFEKMSATVDELQRTIGATLVPVIEMLNEVLKPVVEQLIEFVKEHPKIVQAVFLIAAGTVILGSGLFLVGNMLKVVVGAFGILRLALVPLLAFIGPTGWVILGVGALLVAFNGLERTIWGVGNAVRNVVMIALAPFVAITWLIIKGLSIITGQAAPSFSEIMRDTLSDLTGFLKAIPPVLDTVVEGVNQVTGLDLPNFSEMFQGLKGVFDDVTDSLKFLADAWKNMGDSASTASSRVKEARAIAFSGAAEENARLVAQLANPFGSASSIFLSRAEALAQGLPGGGERLAAFRAGERNPEIMEFIQLLIRLLMIREGRDPELRAGAGQNWLNIQIDGRTIASILGLQAGVGEQVRSS